MNLSDIGNRYKHWHYKNTFALFLILVFCFYAVDAGWADRFIHEIGRLGLAGVFLVGMFFVSTFTVAPATVVLYRLAESYDPVTFAVVAGLGGMTGDFLIFSFLKDGLFEELRPAFLRLFHTPRNLFRSPFFAWLAPVVGAIIIASPLPDELGIGLLGLSQLKRWQFLLLAFCLDTLGIFFIAILARAT